MMPNGIVTLLTDFGTEDVFVGVMKGVIFSILPQAKIVDISHTVPAQNVHVGSLFLGATARYFPRGTVHVAVVDPGVGGSRRAIAVETDRAWYVAPDNGLLTHALRNETVAHIVELTDTTYGFADVSRTFHGRDLFAPVGAHLARGVATRSCGLSVAEIIRLPDAQPTREGKTIRAKPLFADRFGNLVTNLRRSDVDGEIVSVKLGWSEIGPPRSAYGAVASGEWLSIWNSFDLLELASNGGNLAKEIGWTPTQDQYVSVYLR